MGGVPFPKRIRLPGEAYSQPGRLFHVVIRSLPGTEPFAEPTLAGLVWQSVADQNQRGQVRIHAACLMPDHLHLLSGVDSVPLSQWVAGFKRFTTGQSWSLRTGALWQPSFFDRSVPEHQAPEVVRYILGNPVAAGLVAGDAPWPWCAQFEG